MEGGGWERAGEPEGCGPSLFRGAGGVGFSQHGTGRCGELLVRPASDLYQSCMVGSGGHRIRAGYLAISMRERLCLRGARSRIVVSRCVLVTSFPALACSLPRKLTENPWSEAPSNLAAGTSEHRHEVDGRNPPLLGDIQTRAAARDFDQRASPTPSAPLARSGNELPPS